MAVLSAILLAATRRERKGLGRKRTGPGRKGLGRKGLGRKRLGRMAGTVRQTSRLNRTYNHK